MAENENHHAAASGERTASDARIAWRLAPFSALGGRAVHDLLRLRQAVFVLEQTCLFAEIDGLDPLGRHLLAWRGAELVACARLLPAGAKAPARSIGRVATAPAARGTGLGRALMSRAIARYLAEDPHAPIDLSAQAHLEGFYASLGFRAVGGPYDEDGIAHLDMRLDPASRVPAARSAAG
jgi:ElaA protein